MRRLIKRGLLKIVTPEQADRILWVVPGDKIEARLSEDGKRIEGFYLNGTFQLIDGNIEKGESYPRAPA